MWERYQTRTLADIKELMDKDEERKERDADIDKDIENSVRRVNTAYREIDDLRKEVDDLRKDADETRVYVKKLTKSLTTQSKTIRLYHREITELKQSRNIPAATRGHAGPLPGVAGPSNVAPGDVIEINESPSPPRSFSPLTFAPQPALDGNDAGSPSLPPIVAPPSAPVVDDVNECPVPEASSIVQLGPAPIASGNFLKINSYHM